MWLNWKWILALFLLGFLLFSKDGVRSYYKRQAYLKELQVKLSQTRAANKNLRIEIDRLKKDPRAIEQIARRELGLIQPGETEYRFVVHSSTKNKK